MSHHDAHDRAPNDQYPPDGAPYDRTAHRRAGFGFGVIPGEALPLVLDADRRRERWNSAVGRGAGPAGIATPLPSVARGVMQAISAGLRTAFRPATALWNARRARVGRSRPTQLRLPMR